MTKGQKNPKVDAYLNRAEQWQPELRKLRALALDSGLTEELKWGKPCYAFEGGNVIIFIPLRDHIALAFAKGALLKDPKRLLYTPGKSQAGRWIKFADVDEITKIEKVVKAYIREAIEIEKAGLDVKYKETSEYEVPVELKRKFAKSASFKKAFEALTPGRQRGYLIYFGAAKQPKTREERIEKWTPAILKGKGLNDEMAGKRKARR